MATKERKSSPLSNLTSRIAEDFGKGQHHGNTSANRPVPAPSQLMHFSADYKKTTEELEELKKTRGFKCTVPLNDLAPSPFQLGPLNEKRVQGLVDNLRSNPLSTPVVVRRASPDSDQLELVAGHHRVEAFRRLGRTEIDAVLVPLSDDEAERAVFYDNLFAPVLSDHERYLGFSRLQASRGYTQRELAEESGVSQAHLSALLSFAKLPELVQSYIISERDKVSARMFRAMSTYVSEVSAEQLLDVAKRLVEGDLPVTELEEGFPAEKTVSKASGISAPPKAEVVLVTRNNKPFAEVSIRGKRVGIKFKSTAQRGEWQARILEFLKDE